MQEAIETLVVRIVEEKAEAVVAAAVEAPDAANFPEPSDFLTALDAYLTMLPVARDIVREAVDAVVSELPVKASAEASLEGLFAILQVRSRGCSVATGVCRGHGNVLRSWERLRRGGGRVRSKTSGSRRRGRPAATAAGECCAESRLLAGTCEGTGRAG